MQGTGSASATLARSRYRSLPQLSRRGVEGRLHAPARFRSLHPREERVELTAERVELARTGTHEGVAYIQGKQDGFWSIVPRDGDDALLDGRFENAAELVLGVRRRE